MALDGCKELMEFALSSLELYSNLLQNNDINSLQNQIPNLKNWMTFEDKNEDETKIKEQLQTMSLDRVEKISFITLTIVTGLEKIVEDLGFSLDVKNNALQHRILREEVNKEGFPSWISKSNRMLLDQEGNSRVIPNVVVAKDGCGNFRTIQDAINSYPKNKILKGRYIIYVVIAPFQLTQ
ncbi:hypothetical protein PIB30_042235 [Stylosanthes scabra]|uniref:Pectinesterase n=1 Tax=Stylosanthes scabra TaxID=79078 RepID=A0ABU6YE13_9FABA|nr:hypothetical protein [Stylosanthes scabra]